MSKELAQAAGSWRTRVGLALVLLVAALGTVFALQKDAGAIIPDSTATVTGPSSPQAPGAKVGYTISVTNNVATTNGGVTARLNWATLTNIAALELGDGTNGAAAPTGGFAACTYTEDDVETGGKFAQCVSAAVLGAGTHTVSFAATVGGSGTIPVPTVTVSDVDTTLPAGSITNNAVAVVIDATLAATVSADATNTLGMAHTFTFTLDPNVDCASGAAAAPADDQTDVSCTIADVNYDSAVLTVTDVTVTNSDITTATTVTVTVENTDPNDTGAHTVSLDLVANAGNDDATDNVAFISDAGTKTYVAAELRHMSDVANGVIGRQEINSNVRGSRHTICAVQGNTGIDNDNDGIYNENVSESQTDVNRDINGDGDKLDTFADVAPVAITIPLNALSQINVSSGGGYQNVADPDPTFTDAQIFLGNGTNGGLTGATCFSWVSTEAGDQEITVLYTGDDGNPYTVSWDSDNDANDNDGVLNDGPTNRSIVKEWNVLKDSTVKLTGGVVDSKTFNAPDEFVVSVPGTFNPATSSYLISAITISDTFNGSHVNRTGGTEGPMSLAGVTWTVTKTGCGNITSGALSGTTTLDAAGKVVGGPSLVFDDGTGALACTATNGAVITITGTEPGPLGSGDGVTVTQVIRINIVEPVIPTKHVFLAWAGQRVILEHDWRLPPGDVDGAADGKADDGSTIDATHPDNDPDPLGQCAFTDFFDATYIKTAGPGGFLPAPNDDGDSGLGFVVLNGSDQATVKGIASDEGGQNDFGNQQDNDESQAGGPTDQDQDGDLDDTPGGPQDSCISRVLFESEDQGQVDIEAHVTAIYPNRGEGLGDAVPLTDQQTKIAFVIYYMKLNTVKTSLVTAVSKPTHNGTNSDYSPGNPWDASLDVAETDWNVSKDLLVRVRVSGWFVNSNPSGRERDATDPTNVLPADRWVMPDDWAALQGGACGIDCRPEYDYMFAPNNTKGLALTTPEGTGQTQVAKVVAAATNTNKTFLVTDASQLPVGASVKVGTTGDTIAARVGNVITLTTGLAAAPAADTPVFLVVGTPFEGPLSALDIPGLAAAGFGSAALSDWDPNNVRDTRLGDGVLDWWDAPMPPAIVTVDIRGAGFIKQVLKQDVYYLGTANSAAQTYPNPYYIVDIPESPWLPAIVAGGGFPWDTWGLDGPGGSGDHVYRFWTPVRVGVNLNGVAGETLTTAQQTELAAIRTAYGDTTIARRLVVFSDNHGEAMVTANGDFNLTYDDCVTNTLAGGKHCSQDDVVGKSDISAIADYPDFRGKHFPVASNKATVTWTWGGYKEVTVEDGEAEQFKYVVFHALDRDGFCTTPTGAVSLHPVLSGHTNDKFNGNQAETVDFLIDSDEGGIFVDGAKKGTIEVTKEFATMLTYDISAVNAFKEFPALVDGATSECQAWVKVSNSLLGRTNVLVIAHDDEGDIGFDKIVDFTDSIDYTLNFRWSLITWMGADGIPPADALKGEGANAGGTNIFNEVTAVYGWQQDSQEWLAYFPGGEDVPGANDLTGLNLGDAYWIAIKGPASITWTVVTDVN